MHTMLYVSDGTERAGPACVLEWFELDFRETIHTHMM